MTFRPAKVAVPLLVLIAGIAAACAAGEDTGVLSALGGGEGGAGGQGTSSGSGFGLRGWIGRRIERRRVVGRLELVVRRVLRQRRRCAQLDLFVFVGFGRRRRPGRAHRNGCRVVQLDLRGLLRQQWHVPDERDGSLLRDRRQQLHRLHAAYSCAGVHQRRSLYGLFVGVQQRLFDEQLRQ